MASGRLLTDLGGVVLAARRAGKVVWPRVAASDGTLVDVQPLKVHLHHSYGHIPWKQKQLHGLMLTSEYCATASYLDILHSLFAPPSLPKEAGLHMLDMWSHLLPMTRTMVLQVSINPFFHFVSQAPQSYS